MTAIARVVAPPQLVRLTCAVALLAALAVAAPGARAAEDGRYALLVGVEKYDESELAPLDWAEDDVEAIGKALEKLGFSVVTMTSTSPVAARRPVLPADIITQLDKRLEDREKADTVVVALSGHGVQFKADRADAAGAKELWFCPERARPTDKSTLLPLTEVLQRLDACRAGRKLLLVDACRNDFEAPNGSKSGRVIELPAAAVKRPPIPAGMVAVFSCRPGEQSFEIKSLGHSIFSHHVIEFLEGRAPGDRYPRGEVGISELTSYVRTRTRDTAEVRLDRVQMPDVIVRDRAFAEWPLGRLGELASIDPGPGGPRLPNPRPDDYLSLRAAVAACFGKGDFAAAASAAEQASRLAERQSGPDHPDTIASLFELARIQAALDRWTESAADLDRSRRGSRRRILHALASLAPTEQVTFLRDHDKRSFHAALSLGLSQKSNFTIASLSAGWLANGKAMADEASRRQLTRARENGSPRVAALLKSLEATRSELGRLSQAKPDPKQAEAFRAKFAALQDEEQKLVRELGGHVATPASDDPWVDLDTIRNSVPAGSVLVDIARFEVFDFDSDAHYERWLEPRYAAWIIPPAGKGNVTIIDLGLAEEIDAAVAAYREAINAVVRGTFKRGQATAEDELKVTAAPLTAKILMPIVEAVGDATDVIISPDGSLWIMPWQALPLADGSYSIEKFTIRTVTSARDLVPVPVEAKGALGGSVVAADPAFDATPAASGTFPTDPTRSFPPVSGIERRFVRLPGTRTEAIAAKPAITRMTGSEPRLLLGVEASALNVQRLAVRPRVLVFSTHTWFMHGEPGLDTPLSNHFLRCGMALAGANARTFAGEDDGMLTGIEILSLDLRGTELVVLSGGETGIGDIRDGEGVVGLRSAFRIAGANSVVATLWEIPDAESTQIMQTFYANLAEGKAVSKALREAQLDFIKARRADRNYEAAHPYLWAAWCLTGM